MPNIEEIAERIGKQFVREMEEDSYFGSNPGIPEDAIVDFAEALVAELAKGNEPVAWMYEYSYDLNGDKQGNWPVEMHTHASFSRSKPSAEATPLYTLPPTASKIANEERVEQETAEAIAKYLRVIGIIGYEGAAFKGIVSGAWKEFKKS